MKKSLVLALMVLLVFLGVGCGDETTAPSQSSKVVDIVVRNDTSEVWVLERASFGSSEYRGETDAIDASDFAVAAGADFYTMSSTYEESLQYEGFSQTSDTTYEFKMQLIAGGQMPTDEDEQYVYDPYVAVVDFIIKGTYGQKAVVIWDGASFKQIE